MKKEWVILFNNGYAGCDEIEEFTATEEEIREIAEDLFYSYCYSYAHWAFGLDVKYTNEEYKEYLLNCNYEIIPKDEWEE